MVLERVLGSRATRAVTAGSLVLEARRAARSGSRLRAVALLAVAAIAWKRAALGLVAQTVVKLLRTGR